ncbi:hypothetical protein L4C42_06370 [Vibrio wakamikoensis]|uniref:Lipoprotein n=1 Tax=Vibrio chaetopteri TaxID=3016528 RepID=A0AAU8BH13_9VIBR
MIRTNLNLPFVSILFCCIWLYGCSPSIGDESDSSLMAPRWLNPMTFDHVSTDGDTLQDVTFQISFAGFGGEEYIVNNCVDVFAIGDDVIAHQEFARWEWLKASCHGASWYFRSPDTAVSYWEREFDLDLLKTIPVTAVPYLGGQELDDRRGLLGANSSKLNLIKSGEHHVKVQIDNMVIDYVVLARADFNRDGYQDMFIRLDWYGKDSFGEGFDWIVLTKTAPDVPPSMLWRK